MAEITNTPWDERHSYVLSVAKAERVGAKVLRWQFDKRFHVSPFLPMDMRYDWRFTAPAESLDVHMENWREGRCDFDSTLTFRRLPLTRVSPACPPRAVPPMARTVTRPSLLPALPSRLHTPPFH